MNRRGFIQSFIGAAAMAAVSGKAEPVAVVAEESGEVGFGLAPAKAEGSMVAYDPFERSIPKGVLTHERVVLMRAFGLDPTNEEHVEAYLEGLDW